MSQSFTGIIPLTIQLTTLMCVICKAEENTYTCDKCNYIICQACGELGCLNCKFEELLSSMEMVPVLKEPEAEEEEIVKEVENSKPSEMIAYEYYQKDLPHYNFPMIHPSNAMWKYAEHRLEDFITFTVANTPQRPTIGVRYLVGRYVMNYPVYPINAITTDFIMIYDLQDEETYGWSQYVVAYYDKSPFPHEVNVFYPLALPIQFPSQIPSYQ
jgi:hypothetical protein